jgi:hypothetical protein
MPPAEDFIDVIRKKAYPDGSRTIQDRNRDRMHILVVMRVIRDIIADRGGVVVGRQAAAAEVTQLFTACYAAAGLGESRP